MPLQWHGRFSRNSVYKERQIPVVLVFVTLVGTLGRLYVCSYKYLIWRNVYTYGNFDLLHSVFHN